MIWLVRNADLAVCQKRSQSSLSCGYVVWLIAIVAKMWKPWLSPFTVLLTISTLIKPQSTKPHLWTLSTETSLHSSCSSVLPHLLTLPMCTLLVQLCLNILKCQAMPEHLSTWTWEEIRCLKTSIYFQIIIWKYKVIGNRNLFQAAYIVFMLMTPVKII